VVLDLSYRPSVTQKLWTPFPPSSLPSHESLSPEIQEAAPPVPPRREYVWRTIDRGRQSLATVASQITLALDMKPVNKLALIDGRSAHRCAGYVREEITLAPTTHDSAVVSHDAPSPLEICSVCNEVVGLHELFRCICGDPSKSNVFGMVTARSSTHYRRSRVSLHGQVSGMQILEPQCLRRQSEGVQLSILQRRAWLRAGVWALVFVA
jgi:hypothetical protein